MSTEYNNREWKGTHMFLKARVSAFILVLGEGQGWILGQGSRLLLDNDFWSPSSLDRAETLKSARKI